MASRHEPRASASTKLARARVRRGLTQTELADMTGIPLKTYWRLEHGKTHDPSLRMLVNCAIALGVDLDDLIEDAWREWQIFDRRRDRPPA